MKKLLVFMTLLANVICTYAADVLSVTSAGIPKGANGTLTINLSSDVTYAAFQMEVTLPSGLTYVGVANGDLLTTHTVNVSGTTTLTITGSANPTTEFTGTDGSLCVITVKAANDATGMDGSIAANANLTKADATAIYTTEAVPFNVAITDGIVLDEDDTNLPMTQQGVDVTVNRTLKADVWNTVCFPFGMTAGQVVSSFGSDVQACYMSSCTTSGNTITVGFTSIDITEEGILANYPYLIKPQSAITTFTLTAIDIAPNETEAVETVKSGPTTTAKFIGTLKAGTVIPADNLFLSDNKFYYSDGTNTIKGFRGYFWLKDFSSASASRLLLSIDGETTGIYNISSDTGAFTIEDGRIYNLNGMELNSPAKKGIYIQNGKKIVVK